MKSKAKKREEMNLAMEILSDMKRRFIRCRVALIISLIENIIQTAILIFR